MFDSPTTGAVLVAAVIGVALTGCTAKESKPAENAGSSSAAEIAVNAGDSECTLSATTAGTGNHTFVITNSGTKVTEFYVYGKSNDVIAEAENISPGVARRLDVQFREPGTYQTACKPGMVGDGIRAPLTVTG